MYFILEKEFVKNLLKSLRNSFKKKIRLQKRKSTKKWQNLNGNYIKKFPKNKINLFNIYIEQRKFLLKHKKRHHPRNYIAREFFIENYKGKRLKLGLPVHGQRTRSNRKNARYLKVRRIFWENTKNFKFFSKNFLLKFKKSTDLFTLNLY